MCFDNSRFYSRTLLTQFKMKLRIKVCTDFYYKTVFTSFKTLGKQFLFICIIL
jgi:hypothetical protein